MPSRRLLPLVLLAAVTLAACTGSGGDATASTPDGAGPSAAVSADPPSGAGSPAAQPACTAPAAPTLAQTEGPYYTAGAPEKPDFTEAGMAGTRLVLSGRVVDTACAPIAGATVDLWHADASGAYDNAGYRLRGYVLSDAEGRWSVTTIVPGRYPGRTEHIHVKVTPPGGTTLTSQLYFPGSGGNDGDGIYDASLLLAMGGTADALTATYTFVVAR